MKLLLAGLGLFLALAIACGGDDDTSDSSQPAAATDASVTPGGPGDAAGASSLGGVVVTIGAQTYDLDIRPPGCARALGQVSGGAQMTGEEITVSFTIPPEDWETNESFNNPPAIRVLDRSSDPGVQWIGTVDSYSIDDGGASGEAVFRSEAMTGGADFVSETVSGIFDVACGD